MEMFKVYIDLGHGGNDSGALNKARNVLEKNVVLEVGKLVDSKLRKCGLDVKLSRTNDITKSLQQRTNEANAWGADCLVSIHVNDADNRKAKGLETYCYKLKYRKLADCIQEECVKAGLYTQNRGVKEGNLHMVRESKMPAALIELFFINNEEDINKMLNKKEEFATAIATGICKFLGVTYKEESKPTPPTNNDSDEMLAVCIGAFKVREYAEAALKEAKEKGFKDAYLIPR